MSVEEQEVEFDRLIRMGRAVMRKEEQI